MRTCASLLFAAASLTAQTLPLPPDLLRDPWQQPAQVISALSFSPTETVAVIESGYPYFAPRIAPSVKKVYAVNTDPRAFQGRGLLPPGVSPVISTAANPNVASLSLDTVMMVDMLQNGLITQPLSYFLGIVAGLKPGGRLIIIDRILPSVYPASLKVTSSNLQNEVPLAGLGFQQQFTFLPYQYFLIFKL